MEAISIQECLQKLKTEFDAPEEFLRDVAMGDNSDVKIVINSNVDYVDACNMCKELGLTPKHAVRNHSTGEKSAPSCKMDDTISEAFLEYSFADSSNIVMTF